ncbi:ABC transporter substrate-binding protein [Oceanobacillus salinisoli]|uniref:ABC transporter substrate-binding protein n=1 Tax=Oceanobacillus salinisoli TaxID=2678611 RepID=UPI0012E14703|nr:ABC transporter substrate-binding protein [Oceanobacillus salinisoli]
MKRKSTLFVFVLLLSILIVACDESTSSTDEGAAGNDSEVLKVGVIAPLSAGGAGWGVPIQYGVEIAAEEINESGGLEVDGKNYSIEVIAYDDQYIADEAVNAVNRLVYEDEVDFIVGTIGSAGVLGMQQITEQNEVILMANSYATKSLSPDKPFTFRIMPTNVEWGQELVGYLHENYPEHRKVAFISPNDESGWEVHEIAEEDFKLYDDYEIVTSEFPERETQDYNPLLTKIMNTDADIIAFGGTSPGEIALAMNQARALGYEGLFTSFSGQAIFETIEVTGENSEGYVFYLQTDYNTPETQEFFDKYLSTGKYNENYLLNVPDWYDGAHVLLNGIKEADSLDTTEVAEAIRNMGVYEGLGGEWSWTGEEFYGINQQITKDAVIGEVRGGEPTVVDVRKIEK